VSRAKQALWGIGANRDEAAGRYEELRRFAAKNFQTIENDREKIELSTLGLPPRAATSSQKECYTPGRRPPQSIGKELL
jgi:hypothetical protein